MPGTRTREPVTIPCLTALTSLRSGTAASGSDPLAEKMDSYFSRYPRPRRGSYILVALSGGADSVALLAALVRLRWGHRWTIGAAHVNYGLRGAESDEDHRFCRGLCRLWGVRFHSLRPRPATKQAHVNLQFWARDLRYRFFERIADTQGYDHIAVGHTLDDRAENVAAAVIDAAGTFALSGIAPVRGRLIRPLFDCSRRDIEAYLRRYRIPFRRDSSNRSLRYRRNRIRKQVLPQWTALNPAAMAGLARIGEQLWLQRRFLEEAAEDLLRKALTGHKDHRLTCDAEALRAYDRCLDPFVLRAMIGRIGLTIVPRPATVTQFEALRHERNGCARTVEQGDLMITRSKGTIAVTRRSTHRRTGRRRIPIPRCGLSAPGPNGVRLQADVIRGPKPGRFDDHREAHFDLAQLDGSLYLGLARPGDRYRPIGLGGSKKLADLLAERGVPAFERTEIPVLGDDLGILWPIGHPIADRARVTEGTRRILRVRVVRT